ncbi:hypothetical protein EWM64_g2152 [Hericium alpestre]|uniref:Carboxylic ester hydrolase n=1 Tax=Hericium alpestre TaxID=135208 RepID=A0A4Z0A4A8_9AGAM|nr:hypothetical protein EWM64_g2152 [Hericium alpestre]
MLLRFFRTIVGLLALRSAYTCAVLDTRDAWPTIQLDNGTFIGKAFGNVTQFLGIPFAQPPCPQQATPFAISPELPPETVRYLETVSSGITTFDSEDCLTINVIKPTNSAADAQLPVLFGSCPINSELRAHKLIFDDTYSIFLELRNSSDARPIVERSIEIGEPIVYVSLNYRVNAFGFLASEEVKAAGVGNLGLYDQREALRWVQKYITAFGGDPEKVTIYGISAGSVSVALQMLTDGGDVEGLFRAGVMESGSPTPVGDILHGQQYYDTLVEQTACSSASDTLECLRQAPYDQLKAAVDQTPAFTLYKSLNLAWMPRVDGVFLKDHPQRLVEQGSVAQLPMINGDTDDEGTLFTVFNLNTTTNYQTHDYIKEIYLPNATPAELDRVLTLYLDDVTDGSPFDTGDANAVTPEFKRLAAFQGDLFFQAPRRFFLQQQSGKQDTWSYLSKRSKSLPVLGSCHSPETPSFWGPGDMTDYLIRFVAHLDPNGGTSVSWPKYTPASPELLTLWDGSASNVTKDTFREGQLDYLTQLFMKHLL